MEERTRPAVMTLALKVASDSEKLASLGLGGAQSLFQKRSQGESFFKRSSAAPAEGPYGAVAVKLAPTRDSANSGSSSIRGIPTSASLTLDAFAESLTQEVCLYARPGQARSSNWF